MKTIYKKTYPEYGDLCTTSVLVGVLFTCASNSHIRHPFSRKVELENSYHGISIEVPLYKITSIR